MRLIGRVEFLALLLQCDTHYGLAKSNPSGRVRLLAHQVVPFRGMAHRQYIIGEPGGLAPRGREAGMAFNLALIAERFNPAHAVWVSPDRVVDTRKIHGQFAALFFKKMRKQKAHLKKGKWKFLGPHHRVPSLWSRRHEWRSGNIFVESAGSDAAYRSHSAHQHREELQSAGDLPSSEVAGSCVTPDMGCHGRTCTSDFARDLDDLS